MNIELLEAELLIELDKDKMPQSRINKNKGTIESCLTKSFACNQYRQRRELSKGTTLREHKFESTGKINEHEKMCKEMKLSPSHTE